MDDCKKHFEKKYLPLQKFDAPHTVAVHKRV